MAATEAAPAIVSASDPMRPEPFEVRHVTKETGDTFTLTLAPLAGAPFRALRPRPVQHALRLRRGRGARSRSAATPRSPRSSCTRSAAVGATTRAMQKLQKGDWVGVRGPFGTAWPVDKAHGHDVVLIAGRHRPRADPARALPRAPAPGALRHAWCCSTARARRATCSIPKELREWRSRFDVDGRRHRGPGHDGVAGRGGRRDQDGPALPLRPAERDGLHLRPRGDDPLRRAGPAAARRRRLEHLRLDGAEHEVRGRACAATASSARCSSARTARSSATTGSERFFGMREV